MPQQIDELDDAGEDESDPSDSALLAASAAIQRAMLYSNDSPNTSERLCCAFCDTYSLEGLDHSNEDRLWASVPAVRDGPSSPDATTSRRFNNKRDGKKRQKLERAYARAPH